MSMDPGHLGMHALSARDCECALGRLLLVLLHTAMRAQLVSLLINAKYEHHHHPWFALPWVCWLVPVFVVEPFRHSPMNHDCHIQKILSKSLLMYMDMIMCSNIYNILLLGLEVRPDFLAI